MSTGALALIVIGVSCLAGKQLVDVVVPAVVVWWQEWRSGRAEFDTARKRQAWKVTPQDGIKAPRPSVIQPLETPRARRRKVIRMPSSRVGGQR